MSNIGRAVGARPRPRPGVTEAQVQAERQRLEEVAEREQREKMDKLRQLMETPGESASDPKAAPRVAYQSLNWHG